MELTKSDKIIIEAIAETVEQNERIKKAKKEILKNRVKELMAEGIKKEVAEVMAKCGI